MRGGTLDASSTDRHIKLDSRGILRTSKSLIFGFSPADHRHGEELFIDLRVNFLHLVLELTRFL